MERFFFVSVFLLLLLLLFVQTNISFAFPLSTDSRWIVDDGIKGRRVKLTCVNWPSHLETAVAEGLSKQPIDSIAEKIVLMGFNCVRLTWPLYLATDESFSGIMTVRQSLRKFGLFEAVSGFQANNPSILDLPLIKAFQEVVTCLGNHRLMVVLDNHISQPGWCCSDNDGNGFFGDRHLNPNLWIKGLMKLASMFANVSSNVVGMSLRNELRGPKQNIKDWYKYMRKGAEAVHSVNPDILVIVSGLNYDTDLSFLRDRPFEVSFRRKLVFEIHWYGFWSSWEGDNLNKICGRETENIMKMSGFLLEKGIPLFVSEFGIDQRGNNVNDNRFLSCFMALAADLDLDWALWTLAGSYYVREKTIGSDESFGVLDLNWSSIRNSIILQMISAIQSPFRGLMETQPKKIIFHPSSGLCIVRKSLFQLKLGSCNRSESFKLSSHRVLSLTEEQIFCLKAYEIGDPVKLRLFFSESYCSKWKFLSESKMQLSSFTKNGESVCLDVDSDSNNIVTKSCKCLEGNASCNPKSQWFKLVTSTRSRCKTKPFLRISPYSKTFLHKPLSV
ncbi:hypothetical protein EUTSA_v10003934mg [Eutrema salsugineum]|uniref:Glycoside hydrolase family 5 domain-containing protein n=1 Tax=Eutrema salsugineum TaxID=72664 RepID=V4KS82_EUTSA|nr:hypothetical protein EUTSA_v10003934mg [Eutrema salsugineum]